MAILFPLLLAVLGRGHDPYEAAFGDGYALRVLAVSEDTKGSKFWSPDGGRPSRVAGFRVKSMIDSWPSWTEDGSPVLGLWVQVVRPAADAKAEQNDMAFDGGNRPRVLVVVGDDTYEAVSFTEDAFGDLEFLPLGLLSAGGAPISLKLGMAHGKFQPVEAMAPASKAIQSYPSDGETIDSRGKKTKEVSWYCSATFQGRRDLAMSDVRAAGFDDRGKRVSYSDFMGFSSSVLAAGKTVEVRFSTDRPLRKLSRIELERRDLRFVTVSGIHLSASR